MCRKEERNSVKNMRAGGKIPRSGPESRKQLKMRTLNPLVARGSESPTGSSVVIMLQPGSQSQGRQDSSEQLGMTGGRWGEGTNSLEGVVEKKNSPRGTSNYHTY